MSAATHLAMQLARSALQRGLRRPALGARRAAATPSATFDAPTTDATFRYRSFQWRTSSGEDHEYEYVIAQQPAGGDSARSAPTAVDEYLPRPLSGCSVLLIPSVSLVCSGKEEMRPLATLLSQRGHRCYIAEWPGWAADARANYGLARCRLEELGSEYEDFWCQLLEQVSRGEMEEALAQTPRSDKVAAGPPPRICVVGAGHSAIYALRALRTLRDWDADLKGGSGCAAAYDSAVLLAPTWRTTRRGLSARLSAERASRWLASWLHSDSRLSRFVQSYYFSAPRLKAHFAHPADAPGAARLVDVAAALFRRQRPYVVTDAAVLNGFLDPPGSPSAQALAEEVAALAAELRQGVLLLAPQADAAPSSETPETGSGAGAGASLAAALASSNGGRAVEYGVVQSPSRLPQEVATSAVLAALERWLVRGAPGAGAAAPASNAS